MKMLCRKWPIVVAIALLLIASSAEAWIHSSGGTLSVTGRSELSLLNPQGSVEYPFLNLVKGSNAWNYGSGGRILPTDIDSNGYPVPGAAWTSNGGAQIPTVLAPSQYERPGNYVVTWTGQGKLSFGVSGLTNTTVTCTGSASAGPACDNSGCSTFTGSTSGNVLTVTAAPTGSGCTLGIDVNVSGNGLLVSKFGTPTLITGTSSVNASLCGTACTGAGGTGTYAINISQTSSSGTLTMGGRLQISISGGSSGHNGTGPMSLGITVATSTVGNGVGNISAFHIA